MQKQGKAKERKARLNQRNLGKANQGKGTENKQKGLTFFDRTARLGTGTCKIKARQYKAKQDKTSNIQARQTKEKHEKTCKKDLPFWPEKQGQEKAIYAQTRETCEKDLPF